MAAQSVKRKEALAAHFAWKKRVARHLPELSARVFALRGRRYEGCGLQYALEKQLGTTIKIVSTFEYQDIGEIVIDEVVVEAFHADLARAERSANGNPTP